MELQKNPFTVVNLLAFFCIELFPKELETQAKLLNLVSKMREKLGKLNF